MTCCLPISTCCLVREAAFSFTVAFKCCHKAEKRIQWSLYYSMRPQGYLRMVLKRHNWIGHIIMTNVVQPEYGLHLYSTFRDLKATKALYILPPIHPFTHLIMVSRARHHPCRSSWGLVSCSWTPRH